MPFTRQQKPGAFTPHTWPVAAAYGCLDGLDAVWQRLSTVPTFHPRDWTDTYLASFAIQAGCRLVSFDVGFAKYQQQGSGLDFLSLKRVKGV